MSVFRRGSQLHPGLEGQKNVVFTPHIGSASVEMRFRMAQLAAGNLAALLDGQRPPNVVNPEVFG